MLTSIAMTAARLSESRILSLGEDGSVRLVADVPARVLSTVPLADLRRALDHDLPVLVAGDPPIVVGVVQPSASMPEPRLVLEAARELVLRCGAGAIRIAADGTVRIEGRDIRSSARRLQRISGAQVRIN